MKNKFVSFESNNSKSSQKPYLVKIAVPKSEIWDWKANTVKRIMDELNKKGIYKDSLSYAAYPASKQSVIIRTGRAYPQYQTVFVTDLYHENSDELSGYDVMEYFDSAIKDSREALVLVYDLNERVEDDYSKMKIAKDHPFSGLIALFRIAINFR